VILRQDLIAGRSLDLKPNEIAVNVSLDGVQYESSLLKVGSNIGFVVRSEAAGPSVAKSGSEVLGPYRLVSIGSAIVPSQSATSGRSATISVAVDFDKTNRMLQEMGDRLVQAKLNRQIVAVAFYPEETKVAAPRPASL
jgi:hypothetical protein